MPSIVLAMSYLPDLRGASRSIRADLGVLYRLALPTEYGGQKGSLVIRFRLISICPEHRPSRRRQGLPSVSASLFESWPRNAMPTNRERTAFAPSSMKKLTDGPPICWSAMVWGSVSWRSHRGGSWAGEADAPSRSAISPAR